MGVDPYLLPATLVLSMAQRLVKRICPNSGKKVPVEGSIKALIDREFSDLPAEYKKEIPFSNEVLEIEPTSDCPKGTRGRVAVFEIIQMNKEIEHIIINNPTDTELMKAARKQGMLTMKEDAIMKAFKKEIPFEEVNRL